MLGNKMNSLSCLFVSVVFVYFGSLALGLADEENNLRIKGYLQMAYDKKVDIDSRETPECSSGVKAIARMQNRSKLGTKEGISDAVATASEYIDSLPTTWESDFLRLSLALNYAALGDFRSAAKSAEAALAKNDFKRLQTYPDPALEWLRENFGKENFSQSCQDHMHQVAVSYYMDFAESPEHEVAHRHIESIENSKLRDSLLKQLSFRKLGNENHLEDDSNGEKIADIKNLNEVREIKERIIEGKKKDRSIDRNWKQAYWRFGLAGGAILTVILYFIVKKRREGKRHN